MRCCLGQGEELKLQNKLYVIDHTIGEGANCIVYAAHLSSDDRRVRIKELYPAFADIERHGHILEWKSDDVRKQEEAKFREVGKKNIDIQNSPSFGNVTAQIIDSIVAANNTLYMVVAVDNGVTFDKDQTKDLSEILKTILALSKNVYEYHKQGYVHLDIKPQNFLVMPETRDIVKMIDVDSVVSLERIRGGEVECLSYSKGWSAPELIQKRIQTIGYHTDIYSIGAVLFERLFGRVPNENDRSVFKNWNVKDAVEKVYSPSVITLLNFLLEKCLNTTVKKRYQDIGELIQDLEKLCIECGRKEYIISYYPLLSSQSNFIGRKAEINQIHTALKNHKAVILNGFMGIGKTTIAQKYIELYKDDYDAIIFYRYNGSLEDFVMSIAIKTTGKESDEDMNETFARKIRRIRQLANAKTLFVIDNFDTAYDPLLEDILTIDARFLFTSRVSSQDIESEEVVYINLETLSDEECMELFERELGHALNQTECVYLKKILVKYENHSYLTSLLAKYMRKSERTIFDVYEEIILGKGINSLGEDTDCVSHRKDGKNRKDTVQGHVSQLVKMMELSNEHIKVLENIYYLSKVNASDKISYKKMTGARNYNALEHMVEIGLVKEGCVNEPFGETYEIRVYFLHSLIEDLYKGLNRNKNDNDLYVNSRYFLMNKECFMTLEYMFLGQCIPLEMKIFLMFIDYGAPDKKDIELLVQTAIDLYEKGVVNPMRRMFCESEHKYSPYASCAADCMLKLCLTRENLPYKNGISPWWYSLAVISVSYYKMLHARKNHMLNAVSGLQNANEGILEYITNSDQRYFGKYDLIPILRLLKYEMTILNDDVLYTGITIYNNQREILSECGFRHRENPGIWISLRKCTKGEAVDLFRVLLSLCNVLYKEFQGMDGMDEMERFGKAIIWNLLYLDGEFTDPVNVEIGRDISENHPLYFSGKKEWRDKLSVSLIETVRTTVNRVWIYKLILDDVFLTEQPQEVVKKLCDLSVFDMIMQDQKLLESERDYLLNDFAVTNCNRFLTLRRRKYKGKKPFEEHFAVLIQFYGQDCDRLAELLIKENSDFTDQRKRILWNVIVLCSFEENDEKMNEIFSACFSGKNGKYIGQFVLLARNLKQNGYKNASQKVTEFLLNKYAVNEKAKNWKIQVRNAVALSRIAPYHGRNSLKRELIQFVESRMSLEECDKFIKSKDMDILTAEGAVNIVLREVNDELADFLYENDEVMRISDVTLLNKVQMAEKIMKTFAALKKSKEKQIVLEEIFMMAQFLNQYYGDRNLMWNNDEYKSALIWYRKRKRYDDQHNYIGKKYILCVKNLCSRRIASHIFAVCESSGLLSERKEIFDSVMDEIGNDSIAGEGFMDIPDGIDDELPF